jgi:hypothetical protein
VPTLTGTTSLLVKLRGLGAIKQKQACFPNFAPISEDKSHYGTPNLTERLMEVSDRIAIRHNSMHGKKKRF